jgi:hypothetical protein
MSCGSSRISFLILNTALMVGTWISPPRLAAQDSSSSSSHKNNGRVAESSVDAGSVKAGVYRNSSFGFTLKVPQGWVLRTEEMNARENDEASAQETDRAAPDRTAESGCPHMGTCGRVLLAAFSRPPEARAEDVNSSILIAEESAASYPGLTDAPQYFQPVMEVAKAQGFEMDDEPYEFVLESKKLVRADFQKDVGKRVMRQSTLVMLARGHVLSFTFIGGTEDEVEDLVRGLSFGVGTKIGR